MHTASPSVVAAKLGERTPAGKLVTLHFPRRMCPWWFVEALLSVRIRMRTEQAVLRPCPNRGRRGDVESAQVLSRGLRAKSAPLVDLEREDADVLALVVEFGDRLAEGRQV